MRNSDEKFIVIGRFGAPFGVKGWMKIQSFTDPEDNMLQYQPWYADFKEGFTEVKIIDSRKHHKGTVAHIEGCDTKEDTARYGNISIAVARNVFPELTGDEYYWADLEGLTVYTVAGDELGKIDHVMPTGANDVLVIKGQKDILIPYIKNEVVKNIDLDNKTMIVDWTPIF